MPDMDLREVLAEALQAECEFDEGGCSDVEAHREAVSTVLARLSQPDVLDEFARRVDERSGGIVKGRGLVARRVLSDMLGGGS